MWRLLTSSKGRRATGRGAPVWGCCAGHTPDSLPAIEHLHDTRSGGLNDHRPAPEARAGAAFPGASRRHRHLTAKLDPVTYAHTRSVLDPLSKAHPATPRRAATPAACVGGRGWVRGGDAAGQDQPRATHPRRGPHPQRPHPQRPGPPHRHRLPTAASSRSSSAPKTNPRCETDATVRHPGQRAPSTRLRVPRLAPHAETLRRPPHHLLDLRRPTDLHNPTLLCGRHHRLIHYSAREIRIARRQARLHPTRLLRSDLDPLRRPRRNTMHDTAN
jgi:hypothetical protein